MEKRNIISLAIVCTIIISASIAIPITVRDYNIIIDDFLNTPFFPIPTSEGIVHLYYDGFYTEKNDTLPLTKSTITINANISVIISNIWITILNVELLGKRAGNSTFLDQPNVLDVIDGLSESQLIKSGNVTAAEYSGIRITFNSTILVETDVDDYFFVLQGKDFIILPFKLISNPNNTVDLEVFKDAAISITLNLNAEILWQNNTVRLITQALIND